MKVFYFWETRPGGHFPDYLALCVESWRRNIPRADVVRVTYDNLDELTGGQVSIDRIKAFSLPMQSDIVAVGVLARQAGMFMDADTLVLPGFDPAVYDPGRLSIYGDPGLIDGGQAANFLFAPEAGNRFINAWLERNPISLDRILRRRSSWRIRPV